MGNGKILDRCVDGAALAPLPPEDRRRLALLALRAYTHLVETSALSDAADFDSWRHQQCMMVVERRGLRECVNEDKLPLKAHFLRILGKEEQAQQASLRAATAPREWALTSLRREMAGAGDVIARPVEYLTTIARCRFKTTDLNSLSPKQIWSLIFDLRRNAARRRTRRAA